MHQYCVYSPSIKWTMWNSVAWDNIFRLWKALYATQFGRHELSLILMEGTHRLAYICSLTSKEEIMMRNRSKRNDGIVLMCLIAFLALATFTKGGTDLEHAPSPNMLWRCGWRGACWFRWRRFTVHHHWGCNPYVSAFRLCECNIRMAGSS